MKMGTRKGRKISAPAAAITTTANAGGRFIVFLLFALLLLPMAAMAAPYIITGSGTSFNATKDGEPVGTANQSIANLIGYIKTDANGSSCEIQFGDGEAGLNIGTANINFDGSGAGWNATLTGKITSSNNTSNQAGIYLTNGANVDSKADIRKTNANAIRNSGTGTLTISGGTISATDYAVLNGSTGIVNISGGTITRTANNAYVVQNSSTRAVNISGGTISSTGTAANTIYNYSTGAVNISGGNIAATGIAVYNYAAGSVSLGGSPAITGNIRKAGSGNLSVITEGENAFNPEQTYTLDFATYTLGTVALINGKDYLANFNVANADWDVIASGSDAVLANANIVVTVENGTGGRKYAEGGAVMIAADEAPEGQRFKEWQITPEVDFLNGTSKTSPTAIFTVPDEDVEATAVFENIIYDIAVSSSEGGTATATESAIMGTEITLTATANTGYRFKEWEVLSGDITLSGTTTATATFEMPASDVDVKAVFEAKTQQELCEEADNHWINETCKSDADILAEQIAACEESGKVWEDGECVPKQSTLVCGEDEEEVDGVCVTTPVRRPQIAANNIRAYAANNSIVLENLPRNAKVEVYSLQGKLIHKSSKSLNQANQGSDKIPMQAKGIYIVKADTQTFRIAVK